MMPRQFAAYCCIFIFLSSLLIPWCQDCTLHIVAYLFSCRLCSFHVPRLYAAYCSLFIFLSSLLIPWCQDCTRHIVAYLFSCRLCSVHYAKTEGTWHIVAYLLMLFVVLLFLYLESEEDEEKEKYEDGEEEEAGRHVRVWTKVYQFTCTVTPYSIFLFVLTYLRCDDSMKLWRFIWDVAIHLWYCGSLKTWWLIGDFANHL